MPASGTARPSATNAADPIRVPTRIGWTATSSLPANPISPAASTINGGVTGCGSISRRIDSDPASTADNAIITTMNTPARSDTSFVVGKGHVRVTRVAATDNQTISVSLSEIGPHRPAEHHKRVAVH